MFPKVYIIIVNFNGWVDTLECLESIYRIDYPNFQVIVVDNNSTNNSMDYIRAWAEGKGENFIRLDNSFRKFIFPPIPKPIPYVVYTMEEAEKGGIFDLEKRFKNPLILIESKRNGGFAFGNNLAIKYVLAKNDLDYVLLINNDTIVEKDFLTKLVKASLKNEKAGIVGCKIYYYDRPNKIWFNGGKFNEWTGMAIHIKKEIPKECSEFNFITGCCMLIKKEVLEKIGLFDESYFMYVEDLDYSFRTIKNGYKLLVVHNSEIWHKVGSSNGGEVSEFSAYWYYRNSIKFRLKRLKKLKKFFAIVFILFMRILVFFKLLFKRRFIIIKSLIRGTIDGFFG
jgi:hypothetical protein